MARQEINLGNTPSGQGPGADTSRSAFDKCNKNFEELYDDSATLKDVSEKVSILEEEVPLAEAEEGISSVVRGWTARRITSLVSSWWDIVKGSVSEKIVEGDEYIKFPDGTLICYGSVLIDDIVADKFSSAVFIFPHPFSSIPAISVTGNSRANGFIGASFTANTLTSVEVGVRRSDTTQTSVHVVAVGRWNKETK